MASGTNGNNSGGNGGSKADPAALEEVVDACHAQRSWTGKLMVRCRLPLPLCVCVRACVRACVRFFFLY
jgi:hypothetical protein